MPADAARCLALILESADVLRSAIADCSTETTSELTEALSPICQGQGAHVRSEVPCGARRARSQARSIRSRVGHLDLMAQFADGSSLAIEIDRTNKQWSIEKLESALEAGSLGLWVRWRGAAPADHPAIPVLDLNGPSVALADPV